MGCWVESEGVLDLDVVVCGKPVGGRRDIGRERTLPELGEGVGSVEECLEAEDGTVVTIEGREAA